MGSEVAFCRGSCCGAAAAADATLSLRLHVKEMEVKVKKSNSKVNSLSEALRLIPFNYRFLQISEIWCI
jgi:hypothetical protein